jgi:tRNA wybutosine-synthesizing protein 3
LKIDPGIVNTIHLLNTIDGCQTTSSCAGRAHLIDIKYPGDKKGAVTLGKWHEPFMYGDLLSALKKSKNQGWLIIEPPIIHLKAKDLNLANKLLICAYTSGFKKSSLKNTKTPFLLEIADSGRMEIPLSLDGRLLVDTPYLDHLVSIANEKLVISHEKITRFNNNLVSIQ